MARSGEAVVGIIRRRENIKSFTARKLAPLPATLTETSWNQEAPEDHFKQDLADLEARKQTHLSVSRRKGGKKMNRLSLFGLFLGLVVAGSIFFVTGFLMCYALYPPYGGIFFQPRYASVAAEQPSPGGAAPETSANAELAVNVPQRSYADRQAMLASAGGQEEKQGILEKAQQKTADNVIYRMNSIKDNIKNHLTQGVRSVTNKLNDKVAPVIGNLAAPMIEDAPNEIADQQINAAFDQIGDIPKTGKRGERTGSRNAASSLSLAQNQTGSPSVAGSFDPSSSSAGPALSLSKAKKSSLYSVRVRKFNERASALKLAEELKRKGFEGHIVPLWNVDHLEFEVRSGGYEKFSEARDAGKALREQGLEMTSVVMTSQDEEKIEP